MKKRLFGILLACSLLSTSLMNVNAISDTSNDEILSVNGGVLSDNSMVSLQDALESYFNHRTNAFSGVNAIQNQNDIAENVLAESVERNSALREYWSAQNINILGLDNSVSIVEASQNMRSKVVSLTAYEWTWAYYNDGLDADKGPTDRMGFATIHYISAEPDATGAFCIVGDEYDEIDVAGYQTQNYATMVNMADIENFGVKEYSANAVTRATDTNSYGMKNVAACVDYADKYVVHDVENNAGTNNTAYYNSKFGYHEGNDCANYVSQCIFNGGFIFDPSSKALQNADDTSQWWHSYDGTNDSSITWRTVSNMKTYLTGKGYQKVKIASDVSNIYPGNPVFMSGHVVICVGYNSAGKPIINGHTRDTYHLPITSNGTYTETILINTSDVAQNKPTSATTVSTTLPKTYSNCSLETNEVEWFKFTPSTSGTYTMYTTGSSDTMGYLFKDRQSVRYTSNGKTINDNMYMIEQATNDNQSGTNKNFKISTNLTAGVTYYLKVRINSNSRGGTYSLTFKQG